MSTDTAADHVAAVRTIILARMPEIASALESAQYARTASARLVALHDLQALLFECGSVTMDAIAAEVASAGDAGIATLAEAMRRHAR